MSDPEQRALLDQLYDAYASPPRAPRLDVALMASLELDADALRGWIADARTGDSPGERLAALSRDARPFKCRAAWERLATREVIPISWLADDARVFSSKWNGFVDVYPADATDFPHPATLVDCVTFGSDPQAVETAEAIARECVVRDAAFNGPSPRRVRWLSCEGRYDPKFAAPEVVLARALDPMNFAVACEDLLAWERDRLGETLWQQDRAFFDAMYTAQLATGNRQPLFNMPVEEWPEPAERRFTPRGRWPVAMEPQNTRPVERCWAEAAQRVGYFDAMWRVAARNGETVPQDAALREPLGSPLPEPWATFLATSVAPAEGLRYADLANPFAPRLELLALGCVLERVTDDAIHLVMCAPLRSSGELKP